MGWSVPPLLSPILPALAAALIAIAVLAGVQDRRRRRRRDPDRVGLIDWPTVQVVALIGLAIVATLIWRD